MLKALTLVGLTSLTLSVARSIGPEVANQPTRFTDPAALYLDLFFRQEAHNQSTAWHALGAHTLARIQHLDPSFLLRFKAKLTSGNPVLVQQAVHEAQTLTRQVLPDTMQATNPEADTIIATTSDVAIVANTAVFAIFNEMVTMIGINVPESPTSGQPLAEDTLVATLTTDYASDRQ